MDEAKVATEHAQQAPGVWSTRMVLLAVALLTAGLLAPAAQLISPRTQRKSYSTEHGFQIVTAGNAVHPVQLQYQEDVEELLKQDRGTRLWYLTNGLLQPCAKHEQPSKQRISSWPFLSGDTFRSLSDLLFDETSQGSDWRPEDVRPGTVIFVKTDFLEEFFTTRHANINNRYILISHNSDYHAPWDRRLPHNHTKYLSDDKLWHWYAQNLELRHPKTSHIPIGLANQHYPHGNINIISSIAHAAPQWDNRNISLYINMDPATNAERAKIIAHFKNIPGAKVVTSRIPWADYLKDVSLTKYIVAPPGNGVDTHRCWEAIYLGAIPIVLNGPLTPLLEAMPVMLVDSYLNVTQEALDEFAATAQQRLLHTEPGWAMHWHQHIQQRIKSSQQDEAQ